MRLRRLLAAAAASLLAGCGGPSTEKPATSTSTITSDATPSATSAPPSRARTAKPPGEDSSFDEVVAWIEAGQPAQPSTYQTATGSYATEISAPATTTTQNLGGDVAFRSPSKKIRCFGLASDSQTYAPSGLHCLASLVKPPAKPSDVMGQWIGGWVEYDGASASIGSFHGDPGPFMAGDGPELPYGQTISFGQGRDEAGCRMEQTGLWCATKAERSAILINDQGVTTYGCLKQIPRKEYEGFSYAC